MRPTLWPSFTRARARLTATVVLPTPPLPLATATRFFTPGMGWRSGWGMGAGGICSPFLLAETEERFLDFACRRSAGAEPKKMRRPASLGMTVLVMANDHALA